MTDNHTLDLARQWAEDFNACHWTLSPRTAAAADLIEALPDTIVDGAKIRELIKEWRTDCPTSDGPKILDQLEELLPGPSTLADMSPEDRAECQWMQCDVPALEEPGVILHIWGDGCNVVTQDGVVETEALNHVTPLPDLPRMQWPSNEPGDDAPEFDPDYTYRDRDGDEWSYVDGSWRWKVWAYSAPPADYGPYTRTGKKETNE